MGDGTFPGNGSPKINKDYGIVKLRKRAGNLERENELLKIPGFLVSRPCVRCEFPKEHRGEFGSIKKAYETLWVSRSEHYDCVKEVQHADRARDARGVRRREVRAPQGPLRLPQNQPRPQEGRHRRQQKKRPGGHAQARAASEGNNEEAQEGRDGREERSALEPRRPRVRS